MGVVQSLGKTVLRLLSLKKKVLLLANDYKTHTSYEGEKVRETIQIISLAANIGNLGSWFKIQKRVKYQIFDTLFKARQIYGRGAKTALYCPLYYSPGGSLKITQVPFRAKLKSAEPLTFFFIFLPHVM